MIPFQAEILQLKSKGYADDQVKDWLALNGLVVTRQAVQQFVKKNGNAIIESADKNPQVALKSKEEVSTSLPKTGFHEVVDSIKAKNSNSEVRRNS